MLDPDAEHATQLVDHWYWRPGHRPGRPFYTWHLTFEDQHDLHRLVSQYQTALRALPFLDLVPVEWLHITMQGVGFTDEVPRDDLAALVDAIRHRLEGLLAPTLVFQRVTVRPEALALYPSPAESVHRIRSTIREAMLGAQTGHVRERETGYQPHLSIAYVNTSSAPTQASAQLAEVRAEPATAVISNVSLIALQRHGRLYRWQTVQSIPLPLPV
jgi:2'-5' RNA ligase